ncbi:DUF7344 domain-containing protein [Halorussus halophilus]|uniref:DUF7344 domain-containing protein n=1 Tax=Halorussus halophilus TaxID=2650975 RepID=UPI001300E63A|nr:hypothetical protein [Halorussus halophilus]
MTRIKDATETRIEIDSSSRTGRYDVLANAGCKAALRYIRRADGAVGLADLAERLLVRKHDRPPGPTSDPKQRTVELRLHERDLPLLERYGAVDYDRDSGIVRDRNVDGLRQN